MPVFADLKTRQFLAPRGIRRRCYHYRSRRYLIPARLMQFSNDPRNLALVFAYVYVWPLPYTFVLDGETLC